MASRKPTEDNKTGTEVRDLLRAVYVGDFQSAKMALEAGTPVDVTDPETGLCSFHIAIGTDNLFLAKYLREQWHAAVFPDARGRLPTVIAAQCRTSEAMNEYVLEVELKALGLE